MFLPGINIASIKKEVLHLLVITKINPFKISLTFSPLN